MLDIIVYPQEGVELCYGVLKSRPQQIRIVL